MFHFLKYYTTTICRWFLRCRYSRGFGIQSPSAYSFVRYIINEHYPYYAYTALEEEMSERSRSFRKMGRLVFRLANHWQPQYVVMGDYDFAPYAYAGCNSTLVRMIDDYYFDEEEGQRLLVVLDQDWLEDASIRNELLENSSDQMLLLILDIHANQHALHLWNEIISDTRCGVTYDLYSCGIVFFDKSKHKQDFKINF